MTRRLATLAAIVLAAATLTPTAGPAVAGTPGEWTTYHLDNARTGLDTAVFHELRLPGSLKIPVVITQVEHVGLILAG